MTRAHLPPRPTAAALVAAVAAWLSAGAAQANHGPGVWPENDPTSAAGLPPELKDIGIDQKPGAQVPTDLAFVDQDGKPVTLADYVDGQKPTVLVLAYYACPMLCTLVLNGTLDALKGLPWALGDEYRVLTVSFDPRDTPQIAKDKRANYVTALGRPVGARGWDFLTGDGAAVKKLADAVGFKYRWDEAEQQFAHAAGIFVLTPDGRLSRTLFGVHFEQKDLRMALTEASGGKIATLTDRILLFCFHYEPKAGKYVVQAQQLMRLAGVVTVLGIGLYVVVHLVREKRRLRAAARSA